MGFRREVEYLLKFHLWTRRMVIGEGSSIEIAFQEFPNYVNELIYTNLHLPGIIEIHKQHTYFRMQYDSLVSEYHACNESFSLRDDWKIEANFEYVIQYLYDLLVEVDRDHHIRSMLKRRYGRYLIPGGSGLGIEQTSSFEV